MSTDAATEPGYSSDLKEWFNQIIAEEALPFGEVKVERAREGKRADILVYDKKRDCALIIEVKRPEEAATDPAVVRQASGYADRYLTEGLRYFATHNVNSLVLWDARTKARVDEFAITFVRNLDQYEGRKDEIIESSRRFLRWYSRFLAGERPKSIDEGIIETLQNSIRGIASTTGVIREQLNSYAGDSQYREKFDRWLAAKGWVDPSGDRRKLEDYCGVLAKQFLYIFVNKVLFYHVLRIKHPHDIPQLSLPAQPSGESLHSLLETYFGQATKASRDYETVFKTNFIDRLPLPDDTAEELVKLAKYLSTLDYSNIGYDITGKIFEKLIPAEDRHTLGQYFTPSDLTDLILSFCLRSADAVVMDPACGSGTFLVRAYYRLKYLGRRKLHQELLAQLWGIDIDKFPAHLATINLAIRDLSEDRNYPNVVYSDFFRIEGPKTRVTIGVRPTLTAWADPGDSGERKPIVDVTGLDSATLQREVPLMTCVVGNPPYTRQEELGDDMFGVGYKDRIEKALKSDFPGLSLGRRSGIYAYFFPHAAKFLQNSGRLGFVCLRSWLDTAYGAALEGFFLNHFKIVAIIESSAEKWFEDAQMLPVVVVLEACNSKAARTSNQVRFVRLKVPLSDLIPPIQDDRDAVQEVHRWRETDRFVRSLESGEIPGQLVAVPFLGEEIELIEDERVRVISVSQSLLSEDAKWGKFLAAPTAFFRVLEAGRGRFRALKTLAEVSLGTKTGANEFFVLPNRYYDLHELQSSFGIIDRATGEDLFEIEKEFLSPVVVKIKPHREIDLGNPDGFLLNVRSPKSDLKNSRKKVTAYIEHGETHRITLGRGKDKGQTITGYHRVRSVQGRKVWYDLGLGRPAPILFPSIFWARYVAFWNSAKAQATNAFFEIRPGDNDDAKVICALLNSTLSAIFVEFSGRYIENRDQTISNQIMVFEVENMPLLDPAKLAPKARRALEAELDRVKNDPVGLRSLFDPSEMKLREGLDRIVFCDILGLKPAEMVSIRCALAGIVRARIERAIELKGDGSSAVEPAEEDLM